jgi:putative protein kinase ArgK-like GTPase of G3E family
MASAAHRLGLDELVDAIERHRAAQRATGGLAERRVQGQVEWGLRELTRRIGEEGLEGEGGREAVRRRIEARVRSGGGAL